MTDKSFRQIYRRYRFAPQAVGVPAVFAIEMDVEVGKFAVFLSAVAVVSANCIFQLAAAIVNGMYQVVLQEHGQCPEDCGLVNRYQHVLQVSHRQGARLLQHRA